MKFKESYKKNSLFKIKLKGCRRFTIASFLSPLRLVVDKICLVDAEIQKARKIERNFYWWQTPVIFANFQNSFTFLLNYIFFV